MSKLKVLDLFSGIGGFSLGLELTGGFETVAFCEIEEFPRNVIKKHWPNVPCYRDVRELTAEQLAADGIAVDVICGGFPCQDISTAGKGAGLSGERSGLWSEIARLTSELRPRYIIVENVSALLSRGLGTVLGDLAEIGYDAEWHCIPASHVGAPHRRDRIWIIAHPQADALSSDTDSIGSHRTKKHIQRDIELRNEQVGISGSMGQDVADANSQGPQGRTQTGNAGGVWQGRKQLIERCADGFGATWSTEPNVGRVANGVSNRSHRLKGLGNAVVPQIPELIGRAILEAHESE